MNSRSSETTKDDGISLGVALTLWGLTLNVAKGVFPETGVPNS